MIRPRTPAPETNDPAGFIRKVYGILVGQLLLTMAVSAVCVLNDAVRTFVLTNIWTVYVGLALSMVVLFVLMA